jgi:hypothetical protein
VGYQLVQLLNQNVIQVSKQSSTKCTVESEASRLFGIVEYIKLVLSKSSLLSPSSLLFLAQGLFGHLINKADDVDAIGRDTLHKNFAIHVT